MKLPGRRTFTPVAPRGRGVIVGVLLTFALSSVVSVGLSVRTTSRSKHQAAAIEVAARQRTLAEGYVKDIMLVRAGTPADPEVTADVLTTSARVLLHGGVAPAVDGDDDETHLAPAVGTALRAQLRQERRLVADLTATGRAVLAGRDPTLVRLTAHQRVAAADPIMRLQILAALTANVSLNTARTIGASSDRNISDLIMMQVVLGIAGLVVSLVLAWVLIAATRRQTAHFRSLVTSSTDLVLVLGDGGCRYVSPSLVAMLGRPEQELLGHGFEAAVHADDRGLAGVVGLEESPREMVLRLQDRFGEWRHLETHVTDLRDDRHIRGIVLNARDATERIRLQDQLTSQAFHDALTGLANRALFRDRLDQALARCARSQDGLAVLLVDLDGFKQINDSLGHDAGDCLLQELAMRFDEAMRPGDTLARLGGDEFGLLLEGADEQTAVSVCARMLARVSDPTSIAGLELALGASIGIALHAGAGGTSDELVRRADVAMYAAKEAGRGRWELFRPEMARELGEQLGLEYDLRMAIKRGELSVHYQPEHDLGSRTIVGVEALLRWTSPTRGSIPPSDFIPLAETTGLIMPIGEFVLREACLQAAQWRSAGMLPGGFTMWVNISGRQLSAGGLGTLVRRMLDETGLPAELLGLEVTETALVVEGRAGARAQAELEELHELGVRIAIDDFGTGFSAIGQLRRFPIDLIKIDRSFVQGMAHDAKDAAITANVVSLAHGLGLKAIAEGVESESQLASVRELGCDLVQGFLLGRPMPPGALADVLRTGEGQPRAAA
ncbi:MAG TPA: EAL domain-containing protein [Baekduia sp.]|nr:EAL domain-containing protein [Baekduia sp.]